MRKDNHVHVAFVGNPNCGKTTLFNAITGSKLKVANWPGVTVEKMCIRDSLNEMQMLYNGKSLVEDGQFALEVMEHINSKICLLYTSRCV